MKILSEIFINKTRVRIVKGDLTEAPVDAIVNAANSRLQHGGGVAGAIVNKGGRTIQEESDRIGFVPVGQSAITGAGTLAARYVIHTVGPRWGEGNEEEKLRSAIASALQLARNKGLLHLGIPAISAGIFGFPKDRCAQITMEEIGIFAANDPTPAGVDIYLIDQEIIGFFLKEMEGLRRGL
jgi:O-acetyl-ADP-ribose deacetylase